MSLNYNHVTICGRLTKDVELKALPSGQPVASLSVATNHVYTKDGDKKETVEYHSVIIFGRQAENSAKYLAKGDEVLVDGRLQTRSWEKDGVTHRRTEIIAESIQFGSKAAAPKIANTDVDYHTPGSTLPTGETVPYPSDVPF